MRHTWTKTEAQRAEKDRVLREGMFLFPPARGSGGALWGSVVGSPVEFGAKPRLPGSLVQIMALESVFLCSFCKIFCSKNSWAKHALP